MHWISNEKKMDEIGKKKHVREPPSVPFLWEVKPGIPKKDWKPEMSSVIQFPKTQTPLKLIASVPFVWEEKPGTLLPNFSHSPVDMLIHAASSSSSSDNVYQDSSYSDDSESITAMGLETFGFDTDESFGSIPSLLANCIVTSAKVSVVIPLEEGNSSCKHDCDQVEIPLSPTSSETDSCTSSYATGRSSLTGAAFLECLFPLYPPKSGFLEKEGNSETVCSTRVQELKAKDFEHEVLYASDMIRRPATLGELIMMSRRRSCRRKALQMKIWDPPKNITRKQAFGCFTFVTGGKMLEGLLKRKYLPRLKLTI